MIRSLAELLLRRRRTALILLALVTAAAFALIGTRLRTDFAVEYFFPQHDRSKIDYDRYKLDFPYEDCRALVVVEAPDLYTAEGLARIRALEDELARLPGVIDTESLLSVRDVTATVSEDGEAGLSMEKLFPRPDLSAEEIARRRGIATSDPLFQWFLTPPDGRATTLRVTLDPAHASKDERRVAFVQAARTVLARYERPGQRLVLNGLPVIRAEYTEMIGRDMGTLMPLALLVTLALLIVTFRAWAPVLAGLCTLLAAMFWTLGASAALGLPVQLLTQLTPIVCMIVSISDTVHIVAHFRHSLARGRDRTAAAVDALADSAGPCLLTEVVIALGFLGLLGQDMRMISEFGLITAIGMLLTWAANVTVLPLALHAWSRPVAEGTQKESAAARAVGATTRRIASGGERRPRLIVALALLVTGAAIAGAFTIGMEYYAYDDLYPDSPLYKNMRTVESVHGGTVPLAVFLEPPELRVALVADDADLERRVRRALAESPLRHSVAVVPTGEAAAAAKPNVLLIGAEAARHGGSGLMSRFEEAGLAPSVVGVWPAPGLPEAEREAFLRDGAGRVYDLAAAEDRRRLPVVLRAGEPMLEPAAVALMDRIARHLEARFPEVRRAGSAADYWRKIHRQWVGEEAARLAPLPSTRPQAAQEVALLDSWEIADYLSDDRATAAVFAMVPDVGSTRATAIKAELDAWLAEQSAATGYRLTATGIFAIADGIYRNLVGGLALSLGFALVVSLVAFTAVLRSWRLGLIALVPNVLPLVLTLGVMAALGIDLKPTTVICFSITLVIADDDTIQYLVRFRRRYLELHGGGESGHHGRVATEVLHETGASMLVTALTVSAGFLCLVFSEFVGLRNLGLLIGISLFTAVFADLYLSPLMLRHFRPRIARAELQRAAPSGDRAVEGAPGA